MGQYAAAAAEYQRYLAHRRPRASASSTSSPSPTIATAWPLARSIRFAGRSPSTIDSPKRTTCSASVCARPIADRRCARFAARSRSTRRSPPRARSWRACTKTWADGRTRSIELEALAALEPARPERLVNVGLAYARIGRRDTAVLTLGRAAERHPDATVVYTALGRIWLTSAEAQNDPVALGKAIEALQPAAAQADAASETRALYGRALALSGNMVAAERMLLQAVATVPVDPSAYRYLAEVARRLGTCERRERRGSQVRRCLALV